MKITLRPLVVGFEAVVEGVQAQYAGRSYCEALGEAVRNNIPLLPGLEIVREEPRSDIQRLIDRRKEASRVHGNG